MQNELTIEWLGTNAFRFYYNGKIILLDPQVTRSRTKICDKEIVARYIPRADYIFIGHSHWDHLADAAEISRQTNAVVVGSQTTLNICRAQGGRKTGCVYSRRAIAWILVIFRWMCMLRYICSLCVSLVYTSPYRKK